jgi:type IV secretion system protein VirB6
MVGWQLPSVASGLSGGATLSGVGAFVAGFAARRMASALAQAFSRSGGGSSLGGKIRNRTGSGGGGSSGSGGGGSANDSMPAYQRAARTNLGRQGE